MSSPLGIPGDLDAAASAIADAQSVVDSAVARLADSGVAIDDSEVLATDTAHAAAAVMASNGLLEYGSTGEIEARVTCAFAADVIADTASKLYGREDEWGVAADALDGARGFTTTYRNPSFLASLAQHDGTRGLDDDFEMVGDTFRRFAEEEADADRGQHIHREERRHPEEIISGLAEMGHSDSRSARTTGLRLGRRVRLHSDGRGHRGTEPREHSEQVDHSSRAPRSWPVHWRPAAPRSRSRSGSRSSPPPR